MNKINILGGVKSTKLTPGIFSVYIVILNPVKKTKSTIQ